MLGSDFFFPFFVLAADPPAGADDGDGLEAGEERDFDGDEDGGEGSCVGVFTAV